jgi:triphosphoribosyl-dephospho-CoA synthase
VSAPGLLIGRPSAARIAAAATLACTLEACAEKVGNVTPTRSFADARFEDFALSAQALGAAVAQAAPGRVGRTIYRAVEATARVAPSNTNLGMALLFAPLAAAARAGEGTGLRRRLARVLRRLSVDDARWAYRAIRLARPGGLGRTDAADVRRPPVVTLREAMRLAAGRDTVAAEYDRGFAVTLDLALAALRRARRRGLDLLNAIAHAHLEVMARVPDTLIARKAGAAAAARVAAQARAVVRSGGLTTLKGTAAVRRLDDDLRRRGNRLNPGTSADLVAAALFVWLLETARRGRR